MKVGKLFLLTRKKALLIVGAFVFSVIMHAVVYGLFKDHWDRHGGDEPFFFFIAVVLIPFYVLIAAVYTIVIHWKRRRS